MKHWLPPLLTLVLLFFFSMANAQYIARNVEDWQAGLTVSLSAAEQGDWGGAQDALDAVYSSWSARQTYFHIMVEHSELDAAEALFAVSRSYARHGEREEFCANTADLLTQLALLREMEALSICNIL